MKKYWLPTGCLFVDKYEKGELETLSIGDYGKRHNVKADFLGYTKEIEGVPNIKPMPLSEKWVVTLSTQYGCPMSCTFCDVPKIKFKGNVSHKDLMGQLKAAIRLYPDVHYTERLNIHFARMGEPIFNNAVFSVAEQLWKSKATLAYVWGLRTEVIHPVMTTSAPKACSDLPARLRKWCDIKNRLYNGQAGLQLSINSTNETQRQDMFQGKAVTLRQLSEICSELPAPVGRKYCLNFALASNYEVDGKELSKRFNPDYYMVKITPIHNNLSCSSNNIITIDGYEKYTPYRQAERELIDAGFDVLVFIPSMDEEQGTITCGNAVLSGARPSNCLGD